jgi:type IV pilus assembly protein PilA
MPECIALHSHRGELARGVQLGGPMFARSPHRTARGFTLAELMIALAITAILAALAVYGVRRYVLVAKTSEPIEIINSVRAAEEAYKDETFTYLSTTSSLSTYFPAAPDGGKRSWTTGGAGDAKWNELGVRAGAPVAFGYACVAGAANAALPTLGISGNVNYPNPTPAPFYVVKAVGDRDQDSIYAVLLGSSFTDEIYSEKEDE